MKIINVKFVLMCVSLIIYNISKAQLPLYNSYQYLPPGTELHKIDNNPWDDGWIKVFDEGFDIDATSADFSAYQNKWHFKHNEMAYPPEKYISVFRKENVKMSGGVCYLSVKKYGQDYTEGGYTRHLDYTAGGITTLDWAAGEPKAQFETGMFEAEIRMSRAYWGHDNMWVFASDQSEIDACEMQRNKREIPHHLHRPEGGSSCDRETKVKRADKYWHIYTVIWDKYFVYIIVDHDMTKMKVFPKLVNNFNAEETNSTLTGAVYKLNDCFFAINQAGWVIIDQYFDNRYEKENGEYKWNAIIRSFSQDKGLPGATAIKWLKIYKRDPCSQEHTVTQPLLFPYDRLNEKNITLGTNALGATNFPWTTISPYWGAGKYEGEFINILDNFDFHPILADASIDDPVNHPNIQTSFEFIAKDCFQNKLIDNGYEMPEFDTTFVDTTLLEEFFGEDTFNCFEDLDYMLIDSLIDSAVVTNDTIFLNEIYAFLDSLGCPYEMEDSNSNFNARMARVEEEIGKRDPETLEAISRLRVYPNPNNGSFLIATNGKGKYDIQVVNVLGVVVYNGSVTDEQRKSIKLDDALPPGTYTIHINGPGIKHVEKLTIIK